MPSNVSVPAYFRRDHTGESIHNNLTFNLGEGNKITANSIIMALNSPVIADLTTVGRLTSIDATDFSKDAVNCFVKASYTGRLESVTSANVADVLEMGRVFQVRWLVAKCEEFLKDKENELSKRFLKKARKVRVPVNFGRHFIGVPTHENLTFNLGDGVRIKANSIILALNSTVINDLTTNLHQTSLEADDFCREAVECFIESTYTGNIETLNLEIFRDFNKMSRVFKVSWLVAKCTKYFASHLNLKVNKKASYPEMMFAVDEAVYLKSALKDESFLDLVLEKMLSFPISTRKNFIINYLTDLGKSSVFTIDACISMVNTDVHILVELLFDHLKRNGKTSLDMNSRHLLRNMDMEICFLKRPDVHTEMFNVLESLTEVTREDFLLLLHFHKQNTGIRTTVSPVLLLGTPRGLIDLNPTVDSMLKKLSARKCITDLYSFIDGLWLSVHSVKKDAVLSDCHVTKKIINLAKERGWSAVDWKYTNFCNEGNNVGTMFSKLSLCEAIVRKNNHTSFITVFEYSQPEFIRELFLQDNAFRFHIPGDRHTGQTFVLLSSAVKEYNHNSFNLRWFLSNSSAVLDNLPKLHFALLVHTLHNQKKRIVPITWCGQPTSFSLEKCWNWGYIRFHKKGCKGHCRNGGLVYRHIKSNDRVGMIVFIV